MSINFVINGFKSNETDLLKSFQWDLSVLSRKYPMASFCWKKDGRTSSPLNGLEILDKDPQYSAVCDSPDCDQTLDKNLNIYIWSKENTEKELSVCESCNQEMSSWRADGWVEQGDHDEILDLLNEYFNGCDWAGNNVCPVDFQDYLQDRGHYLTYRECCYLFGDSEQEVDDYMLSQGRNKSDNEVHGDD